MNTPKLNRILVVIGKKGKGKSFFLERVARETDHIIMLDLIGAYVMHTPRQLSAVLPGFSRMATPGQVKTRLSALGGWYHEDAPWKILYHPKSVYGLPPREEAELHLAHLVNAMQGWYRRTKMPSTIMVDEVDYLPKRQPITEELVKRGRHSLINQAYATRRPFEIPRMLTSQADDLISFQVTEPNDLRYLQEHSVPRQILPTITTLKLGDFVHYDISGDHITLHRKDGRTAVWSGWDWIK